MDGIAGPGDRLDAPQRAPHDHRVEDGLGDDWPPCEGRDGQGTPQLTLDGFCGPLARLLSLSRAQAIDLRNLSLAAFVEQLETALRQAPPTVPLSQKGDWVVMATWLVQLRARLLLPVDAPAQQQAQLEADQLRERLVGLQAMQALAGWLERRPQLGQDGFARGRPEVFGVSVDGAQVVDGVEFLWASLVLFDDDIAEPDTTTVYRPRPLALHDTAAARARILRRLAANPGGGSLDRFLPDPPDAAEGQANQTLLRRSAWSSTLVASLELVRQGIVMLDQAETFKTIQLTQAPTATA